MIIEKAKFPDYRYEFIYTISQNQGDYFLSFDFFGPIIKFSDEELAEIYGIIGVESVEWIKFPEKAKIKLSFVESAYKAKT